jgi:transcriptional regulator with XRE-family HTH domain
MEDIRKIVGRNVRTLREVRGFSQEELSFECGLHRTYISGIERGVRNPTVLIVEKIAVSLDVAAERLLVRNTTGESSHKKNEAKR